MELNAQSLRRLRLRAQGLDGTTNGAAGIGEVVARRVGVQAQEELSAWLGVWARSPAVTRAEVERACGPGGSIVRSWTLRGTLHLVTLEDLAWQLPLLGPEFIRGSERRYRQLKLGEAVRQRALGAIGEALGSQGPLPRRDLIERMAQRGLPTEGQAAYYLLRHAALAGVAALLPDRDGKQLYASLEGRLPPQAGGSGQEALERLLRRYWRGYGPATVEDAAAWSGLPRSRVRRAFQRLKGDLVRVSLDGEPAWMLEESLNGGDEEAADRVHLIPAYDAYLLGYRSRDWMVDGAHAERIHPGGGLLRPALLVEGEARGTWRMERIDPGVRLEVEPFGPLERRVVRGIEARAAELAHFLGVPVELEMASV